LDPECDLSEADCSIGVGIASYRMDKVVPTKIWPITRLSTHVQSFILIRQYVHAVMNITFHAIYLLHQQEKQKNGCPIQHFGDWINS